ncbi:MAG TPA: hypothetical protein VGR38_04840, partial [Candidatus Polarisedimenticolia bacterium]|nr:hypothetical protein [Candidatus Polarisedimenticolia bacterium]
MNPRLSTRPRTRLLLLLIALLPLLTIASIRSWAVKRETRPEIQLQELRDIDPEALSFFSRHSARLNARPLGLNPMGDSFKPAFPGPAKRKGLIYSAAGFADLKKPTGMDFLPGAFRPSKEFRNGGGLDVLLVQIGETALKSRGIDSIEEELRALGVSVVNSVPERGLVLMGEVQALKSARAASFVEASTPYPPGFKVDPAIGTTPLISKLRASSRELELIAGIWPGFSRDKVLSEVRAIVGSEMASPYGETDGTIRLRATPEKIAAVAGVAGIRTIQEDLEFLLASAEVHTTAQVGEVEHTAGATPYWSMGVDGGGLGLGSAVPPQIVAVTDNGVSTDTVSFAQSNTALTDTQISALITGGTHRKIASYQLVGSHPGGSVIGESCDGLLSGSATHGNVVGGIIAGSASPLGAFATISPLPGYVHPNINMDGIARGARLVVQDAGSEVDCVSSEIVEHGGNVNPGSLTDRMVAARDAGARLHVMPFAVPNFTAILGGNQGTYTVESSQVDTFLANNLDYMVFSPVGNAGMSLQNGRDLIPDLFD